MDYSTRASDYLRRARQERQTLDPARLFYAALELRCGVEARLHEYRNAIRSGKNTDNTWQVRLLMRDIERFTDKVDKPITVRFHNQDSGKSISLGYVPIPDELKTIAGRLGDYLHCVNVARLRKIEFWTEFRSLTDRGITLLSKAVSGHLLAPPMFDPKSKSAIFKFDEGKMPEFLDKATEAKFSATFRVISKTPEKVTLKIT